MDRIEMAKRIEMWRVDRLVPYLRNARTHSEKQIERIAASISEFGFTNPILVDSAAGIIAGHGRLLAAQKLQLPEVPVIVLDYLTEVQKRAYIIADNQLTLDAGWDEEVLQSELAALEAEQFDLNLIGFVPEELARLLVESHSVGLVDEDAIPELPGKPVSMSGDVWILGDHRLRVGDATNCADVAQLMAGEAADLLIADVPYNVNYQGYTKDNLKIEGDCMSEEDYKEFLKAAFCAFRVVIKPDASLYVFHASSWQREFQNALEAADFQVRCQIIWAKNTFAWGFGRYKFQHEPIFYAHVMSQKDPWYGDKSQSTLWEVNKPAANRIHPTSKPVELIERAVCNSTRPGDIVADLFAGSGSALIACERHGRKALLMEIDPKYADCIVQRWQDYSGKKAILESGDWSFEEARQKRRPEQSITESNKG